MDHSEHLMMLINKAYSTHDHGRVGDTSIHVSDLINFCPREYYLCKNNDRGYHPYKFFNMQGKWIHDVGHAYQKIQVHRLMSQQVIFGTWKCRVCAKTEVGFQSDTATCPSCTNKVWRYEDLGVQLRIPVATKPKSQLIVRGNIDFVVALSNTRGFLVDAKSIKGDKTNEGFDALKEPSLEYRRQVQLYMWLAGRENREFVGSIRNGSAGGFTIDPENAVVCYSSKGSQQVPFKSFLVKQDPKFIKTVEGQLKELKTCLEKATEPKKMCKTQHDLMAKQCVIRDVCFGQIAGRVTK